MPRIHGGNGFTLSIKEKFSPIARGSEQETYLSFYVLASNITHADISSVLAQADPEPGVLDVGVAPSEEHIEMAFVTGHLAFVLALAEYITMARREKQHIAKQLDDDFSAVCGTRKEETAHHG
jgi:hypothetical protein